MKRRAPVLVDGPRVSPSVQQQLAALRMTVGSSDVHRSPLIPVFRLQRRPTSEQLSSHLKVSLSDRQHQRGPSIGISLVYDAPGFQEGSYLGQVSISCSFVYIDLVACHARWHCVVCSIVSSASRNKMLIGRCDTEATRYVYFLLILVPAETSAAVIQAAEQIAKRWVFACAEDVANG